MTYSRMDIEIERTGGYAMPIMTECNSGAWLKEVRKRVDRLQAALVTGDRDRAQIEARELVAASQIAYEEVVHEARKV
ncbi:hypothetical protein [Paraburkholderia sp. BL9I2N2]|uniref:hypothetical protein n=1 Tax=Paraburkholderia sp. BL9I2N2 TaxID=1938809 RepID=UPI00104AFADC|nr:hypothetical protein [Paraburkholderia sp. BL9I2N2]TCK87346.1 hypothetical protein B0G74_7885 [Paraburkholderia sp. BL9I2N2]